MTDCTVFPNTLFTKHGYYGFAFTGGQWLYYYATGHITRRDPSSASSTIPLAAS